MSNRIVPRVHKSADRRRSLLELTPVRRHRTNLDAFEAIVKTVIIVVIGLIVVYLATQATIPTD